MRNCYLDVWYRTVRVCGNDVNLQWWVVIGGGVDLASWRINIKLLCAGAQVAEAVPEQREATG